MFDLFEVLSYLRNRSARIQLSQRARGQRLPCFCSHCGAMYQANGMGRDHSTLSKLTETIELINMIRQQLPANCILTCQLPQIELLHFLPQKNSSHIRTKKLCARVSHQMQIKHEIKYILYWHCEQHNDTPR